MLASEWKVLLVDDDPDMHHGLQETLSNRMGGNKFAFTCTSSFDNGLDLIRDTRFDLLFLDVHDETSDDPDPTSNPSAADQRGEELLEALKSLRFVPVIFYTGFPAKVAHLESPVIKVVDKGSTHQELRDAVNSIFETGLPYLVQYIEEKSRSYIWNSLEEVLKQADEKDAKSDVALLAARNLAKNLSQRSIKELFGSDVNSIAPLEMYLYPPEQDSCNPGDIFRNIDDQTLWMVLTPACDFEQNKVENVLLARVIPLEEHDTYKAWRQHSRELEATAPKDQTEKMKKAQKEARGKVKSLVKNQMGGRFRFLPGTFFLPDCIVDFQRLLNLPVTYAEQYEIVCSLDNPHREEVLQLFSTYYGRIGTPDYEFDAVWQKIDQKYGS